MSTQNYLLQSTLLHKIFPLIEIFANICASRNSASRHYPNYFPANLYQPSLIASYFIAFSVICIAMLQATGSSEGAAQQSRTGTLTVHPCLTLPALTPEGMAYIRRRNERERERVRCVNDHYECLRRYIPHHFLQAAYGDSQALEERGV